MPIGDLDPNGRTRRSPRSIRMMGQETGQRSSLTVNHGTYYVDTTVGRDEQLACTGGALRDQRLQGERDLLSLPHLREGHHRADLSVLRREKHDFEPDKVRMMQANIGPNPVGVRKSQIAARRARPVVRQRQEHREGRGGPPQVSDFPDVTATSRAPSRRSVSPRPTARGTAHADRNDCASGRQGERTDSGHGDVCRWAVAEQDCPDGGCIGIAFTLPAGFATRPTP